MTPQEGLWETQLLGLPDWCREPHMSAERRLDSSGPGPWPGSLDDSPFPVERTATNPQGVLKPLVETPLVAQWPLVEVPFERPFLRAVVLGSSAV